MSNAPGPAKEPATTSPLRVGILLGVLVLVIGLLGYDFMIAKPATEKAYNDVMKLSNDTNAKGVAVEGKINAGLLQPADVQTFLKKKPSSVKKEKDYLVEYYWWGGMPHRNFISVLYYGSGDNLRFNTHYQNASPNKEDLPNAILPEGPPTNQKPGREEGPPTKPADANEEGTPPKPESTDKPSDDKPTADKPAPDKPTADKPAEDKPTTDKP
jgi:hypothetical protein